MAVFWQVVTRDALQCRSSTLCRLIMQGRDQEGEGPAGGGCVVWERSVVLGFEAWLRSGGAEGAVGVSRGRDHAFAADSSNVGLRNSHEAMRVRYLYGVARWRRAVLHVLRWGVAGRCRSVSTTGPLRCRESRSALHGTQDEHEQLRGCCTLDKCVADS